MYSCCTVVYNQHCFLPFSICVALNVSRTYLSGISNPQKLFQNTKKTVTRLDRHMRQFQEKKKKTKLQRAVTISIEGRHMSL